VPAEHPTDLATRYYTALAAAYVRGTLPGAPDLAPAELVRFGLRAGLRLRRFQRAAALPRVRKVLGLLRGLGPADLLDVGSGRGVSLWPLLDAFPGLPVLAIDTVPRRVEALGAVAAGGVPSLRAARMDVTRLALPDRSADGVTCLDVLESLPEPGPAVAEVVRVARRFVLVSVPSRPDDDPAHLHLFSPDALRDLFAEAGVTRVRFDFVLNHLVALAML
jgi:ubiquinone/menaquinone biosynthesis C-methylase UbiE